MTVIRPALVVFSGLSGVGKTTLAARVAMEISAVHVRIDTLESAIKSASKSQMEIAEAGYLAGYGVARDNLLAGHVVIADAVNALEIARRGWRDVAAETGAVFYPVEITNSDPDQHRERLLSREADLPNIPDLNWQEVSTRAFEPWPDPPIRVDTARLSIDRAVMSLLNELGKRHVI